MQTNAIPNVSVDIQNKFLDSNCNLHNSKSLKCNYDLYDM